MIASAPTARALVASAAATILLGMPVQTADGQTGSPMVGDPRCTAMAGLRLPNTEIAEAAVIPEKAEDAGVKGSAAALPAFCRVVAHVRAAPGSDIAVEVWLPLEGWTGVFHGNGNGGFAGVLASGYLGMAAGLRRGYATAVTDTGTAPATPLDGAALIGHPRKWKDWGRLSTHVMTVTGKAITAAFYGHAAHRAFYTGCSTGGQQGLIEALYYPADYDGILVGAPVINRTWGHAAVLWDFAAAHRTPESLLSEAKLRVLNRAALTACARQGRGLPGDEFVSDPIGCVFDPKEAACRGEQGSDCLSAAEVATARAFYTGPKRQDGRAGFYGWLPGSEGPGRFGWSFLQSDNKGQPQFGALFNWVFGPGWDWRTFDVDRDMAIVNARLGPSVNDAVRGNLRAFAARGGKLIIYHGLADTLVPPEQSLAFYKRHARELGGSARADGTVRLFLAPGMQHCAGGTGADAFNSAIGGAAPPNGASAGQDLFQALTDWTEHDRAPTRVVATKFDADRRRILFQRPICVYPGQALYVGSGARRDAASYRCTSQRR